MLKDVEIVCLKCKEPKRAIDGFLDLGKSEIVFNLECGHSIHVVVRTKENEKKTRKVVGKA